MKLEDIAALSSAPFIASGAGLFLRYILSCTGCMFPTRMTTKEVVADATCSVVLILVYKFLVIPVLKERFPVLQDQLLQFGLALLFGFLGLEILPRAKAFLDKKLKEKGFDVPNKSDVEQTS